MGFTCISELEISGGTESDRRAAAALVLASDSVDEDSASREERASSLVLRFESVDGLPEEELVTIAPQFSELSFLLVYFSRDGEFYGYARRGARVEGAESAALEEAESADLEEADLESIGRRHDGDGIAFAKERFGLARTEA
jgi:hypothetical protein